MRANRVDKSFWILFLIALCFQIPFAWILWIGDTSQAGFIRASAIGDFVLPTIIVIILWWTYAIFEIGPLRVVCWYGMLTIVWKSIILSIAFLSLIPIRTVYSSNQVQLLFPLIPLMLVFSRTKGLPKLESRSLLGAVVGVGLLWLSLTYMSLLVLFLFHPLF